MTSSHTSSRGRTRTIFTIVATVIVSLFATSYLLYAVADDTLREGEGSAVTARFVDPYLNDPDEDAPLTYDAFPSTFGQENGTRTLVLYDHGDAHSDLYALGTANLATHFGAATLTPISDYTPGQMHDFDAAVYVGASFDSVLPAHLIDDILDGRTEVLWAGTGVQQLSGPAGSALADSFTARYGWSPATTDVNEADQITAIVYKGQELNRDLLNGSIHVPVITDPDAVEVLGVALCGTQSAPEQCRGAEGTDFPWAIRSGNITYVADMPLEAMHENTHHLAYADLFYDLLAPGTAPTRKAAVRFEDVGPEANPEDLRRVADYLHERDIPFQVAVVPVHVSEVPGTDPARHYGITLLDRPHVVDALKYMQERGGTLIQHGTSHQYGAAQNPYPGATSGADYEFFRARCSAEQHDPKNYEECGRDSWVQLTGPVSKDAVEDHAERIVYGRQIMQGAGLGDPEIFEVPHYAASPNAYRAITENYDYRYERTHYVPGLTSGVEFADAPDFSQIVPYRVHDVYGNTVLPENLGNVSEEEQNNHPPRPPAFLVDNAQRNLVVTESTASFFFHPYLSVEYLDEVVTGILDLGYDFVPATEL